MKISLASVSIITIVGLAIATIAMAGQTVTCTVTPGNYSVSVSPTSDPYSSMTLSSTKTGTKITATNDGTLTEKINIAGSNATYTSYTWVLDSSLGTADHYVHAYTTDATPPATGATLGSDPTIAWVPLDTTSNYKVLVASKVASGTQDFYLDMRTPTSAGAGTSYGNQYSITITLQAVAP